jgi:hydrogenase expression/formation protein HypC
MATRRWKASTQRKITRTARVDFGGIVKEINLAFTPEAAVGNYVLVHVGFAIALIDEGEAGRVLKHLREIGELISEERQGP